MKYDVKFCIECGTFTEHYGTRFPVYCSLHQSHLLKECARQVYIPIDYDREEDRPIFLKVGRNSVLLTLAEADSLSVHLSQCILDIEKNLEEVQGAVSKD